MRQVIVGPAVKDAILDALRDALTEENTDRLIDLMILKLSLPWWIPTAFIRKILDRLLPDVVLNLLEELLA